MHVRLIDGNSVGHSLHIANNVRYGVGFEVQAIEGFVRQVRRWRQVEPDALHVVLWDGRAQWRHDMAPEYKSGRLSTDEQRSQQRAYEQQRPWLYRVLEVMPVVQVTHPFLEAADLAYALSCELSAQGHLVSLTSTSQSWLQCVRQRVSWANPRKRDTVIDDLNFKRETGCANPAVLVEAQALAGGTPEGLEGAPGINYSRARELLAQYGSLAEFWRAADDPFFQGPKYQMQAAMPDVRERVLRNKRVLDLSEAPPPDSTLTVTNTGELVDIDLYEIFSDLGLSDLCESFEAFSKALGTSLTREQTAMFRRTVANMGRAYAKHPLKG